MIWSPLLELLLLIRARHVYCGVNDKVHSLRKKTKTKSGINKGFVGIFKGPSVRSWCRSKLLRSLRIGGGPPFVPVPET